MRLNHHGDEEERSPSRQGTKTARAEPHLSRVGMLLAAVGVLTVLAYGPSLRGEFLWDDYDNILERDVVKEPAGVLRIWTDLCATQQFYPLTHTTFWLEYQLFGEQPLPYRLSNLFLHLTTALLLWRVLQRLGVPGAALAASLFAIHPLHVESVAWITERKNLLSATLCLASTGLFCAHQGWNGHGRETRPGRRFGPMWRLSLVFFVLALAAKTTVSVVPAVLLLCTVWKNRRLGKSDLLEIAPFFAVGVAAGLLTAWLEVTHVLAHGSAFEHGFLQKLLRAAHIFWFYPAKLVYPGQYSFVYPRWNVGPENPLAWAYLGLGVAVLSLAVRYYRKRRSMEPLVTMVAYGVLIFPALGFFNVYFMQWSYVQHHFCYLASAPVLALVAALWSRGSRRLPRAGMVAAVATVLVLAVVTATQASYFSSYNLLFEHSLKRVPDSWFLNYNLGVRYQGEGRVEKAEALYRIALCAHPGLAKAHINLAVILVDRGDLAEGLEHIARAVEIEPSSYTFRGFLGLTLMQAGYHRQAIGELTATLAQRPSWTKIRRTLAWMYATSFDDAVRDGKQAVELATVACEQTRKTLPRCLSVLAAAYAEAGQTKRATETATTAAHLAGDAGNADAANRYTRMARAFAEGRPHRVPRPAGM